MNVLNPSPVPIRLPSDAVGAYLKLTRILHVAADQAAANGSAEETTNTERLEWFAVRDALRAAAGEAMVPRGGTGLPRCRRCGIDCAECTPADSDASPPPVNVTLALNGYGDRGMLVEPGQTYAVSLATTDAPAAILAGRQVELNGTITVQVQP